ncbi:MAG: IS200/IS605 family transposase [bacterium]
MPNTYSQINLHVVFTVKGRYNLIPNVHKEELHKYITGLIKNKNQKLLAINGMSDHIHVFISIKPEISVSELVRDIKRASTIFINEKNG